MTATGSAGTGFGLPSSPTPFTMTARLPPPVTAGARVGVAALSSKVDPERLARGMDALTRLGFTPVPARNLDVQGTFFAGGDEQRLEAFHELLDDSSLDAIFFARGGHGVTRLLPRLDWELMARRPRAFVGYSDLSPFLHQVVTRLGWVAFHGPMVAADLARGLSPVEEDSLLGMLAGDLPRRYPARGAGDVEARGILMGGCLSLFAATCGTPFAARFDDAILFLEDVDEPAYRVDRMLTQLRLSGSLTGVRAMVLADSLHRAIGDEGLALVGEHLRGQPLAVGLEAGHAAPNLTLPLGIPCTLLPGEGGLLLEAPTP